MVPMTGELWGLLEEHRRRIAPATISNRRVGEAIGLSPTAVGNWSKGLVELPKRRSMLALADLIRVPYERVLEAALRDAKYLPERAAREDQARVDGEAHEAVVLAERLLADAGGDHAKALVLLNKLVWELEPNVFDRVGLALIRERKAAAAKHRRELSAPADTNSHLKSVAKKGQIEDPGEFNE